MEQAIKLRSNTPDIGPQGLVLQMPDRIHPLTLADLFEVLRWVHGDLKQIHSAFGHVDRMRSEVATIKQIHKKQEYAYRQHAETLKQQTSRHADLLEKHGAILAKVQEQEETLKTMADALVRVAESVSETTTKFKAIEERVMLPWWKKMFR